MWLRVEVEYSPHLSKKCLRNLAEVLCKVTGESLIANTLSLKILLHVN